MSRLVPIFTVALAQGAVLAHPDHTGTEAHDASHFLTDPFHVGLAALGVLLAVTLRRSISRRHTVRG